MKIGNMLRDKEKSISFEYFPPKTDSGERSLFETINKLSSFKPTYISMTYGAGGSTKDKTIRMVERIVHETSLTVMPHLTCINASKDDTRGILDYYNKLGIENILALRGDPPMGATELPEIKDGFDYARDLIKFIKEFYDFSISAAVYPEGHRESSSIEMDMAYTKEKVDLGAEFLISQMFFDNRFFYEFLERCDKLEIDVPIIPGMMIITDFKKIGQLSSMCGTSIPTKLAELIEKYGEPTDDARKVGMEFTIKQCNDLLENGVKYLHFYTLNRWEPVTEVINSLSLA
jgi:methylenetetrahydrofolate reductase (NADPH)